MTETDTSGWDAIDAALADVYGDQEPLHYGTVLKHMMGGPDPIDGISVYRSERGAPHWHFVTYGYSELYTKESDNPDWSGYGFEMTFRLRRGQEPEPPGWSFDFLQNLARYVFKTGNVLAPGHHMSFNGPIALETDTRIVAGLFAADPELPTIESPHGKVVFVQVVGVTVEEYEAASAWNTDGMLEVIGRTNPMLVTDLKRASVTDDPDVTAEVERCAAEDGSGLRELYVSAARWESCCDAEVTVTIGALAARGLVTHLPARIPHEAPLVLIGEGGEVANVVGFEPAESPGWKIEEWGLSVGVTPQLVEIVRDSLPPQRGEYRWPELPGLVLVVEPSQIKDADGNVSQVLG